MDLYIMKNRDGSISPYLRTKEQVIEYKDYDLDFINKEMSNDKYIETLLKKNKIKLVTDEDYSIDTRYVVTPYYMGYETFYTLI